VKLYWDGLKKRGSGRYPAGSAWNLLEILEIRAA